MACVQPQRRKASTPHILHQTLQYTRSCMDNLLRNRYRHCLAEDGRRRQQLSSTIKRKPLTWIQHMQLPVPQSVCSGGFRKQATQSLSQPGT